MDVLSGSIVKIVSQFEAFLKEISSDHGGEKSLKLAEQALELTKQVPSLDFDCREHRTAALKLHTIAINVWNLAVGMRTTGASSMTLNAHLRHIACSLVFLTSPSVNSEANRKKQLTMAVKTGRAWLDCGMPGMADTSLSLAKECWEKLAESSADQPTSVEAAKQLFKILCFKAEASVGLEMEEKALSLVREARDMVRTHLEKEAGYLSMLCYNFGLEAFQKEGYEHSTTWLKESYELGQGCADVGAKKQSRTLRLLANAYLEWDSEANWKKALNAVGLANSECSHPTGFYLKCYILLKHDVHDSRLKPSMEETLRHTDVTADLAQATVQLLAKHQRVDLSLAALRIISSRFKNSPDLGKFQLLHLEILLQEKHLQEAKDVLEDAVVGHNAGSPLDVSTRKGFHLILWEQAAAALDREDCREAVMWYNYSHSLFSDVDTDCKNLAKLQRNRCNCYIMLEEYDMASMVLSEALEKDGSNPYTQYMAFKLAMARGDTDRALEAGSALCAALDSDEEVAAEEVRGLVCLAAQVAFEKSTPVVALKTLEQLTAISTNHQQLLTALRCLTRLRLSFMNKQEEEVEKEPHIVATVGYIQKALEVLSKSRDDGSTGLAEEEVMWFVKVAWNLALQCSKAVDSMYKLFTLCGQLLELCSSDENSKQKRHTCLLMATASCLQIARDTTSSEEKTKLMKEVLQIVVESHGVQGQRSEEQGQRSEGRQTEILFTLYEFEARAMIGLEGLNQLLEKLTKLPTVVPKTFEIAAALAVQSKLTDHAVCEKALKLAIQSYRQQKSIDYSEYSKCYHSLVGLYLETGGHQDMVRMEKAWAVLQEALKAVKSAEKEEYPEVEILWLMTKVWNNGVRYFSGGRYKEAEQWCSLSMQFLQHLTSFQESYQQQMSSVYSEILDKLTSSQAPAILV